MQNSSALPVLQMLPVELLAPHEDYDPRRVERLAARLVDENHLKNPPVVAGIPGTDRFVVLDGANRVMAFQFMKVPHIVAQVVSYDDPIVTLETWHHVVCGMDWRELLAELETIDDLEAQKCTQEEGREAVMRKSAAAYIMNDYFTGMLVCQCFSQPETMRAMHAIVASYRGKADIIRASNDIWEIQKPCYPNITALVVFRRLSPSDILEAGRNGERVPSGLTRHVIHTRALNINIPMNVLSADWGLERKRQWLDGWWQDKFASNSIRYYAESTFSFNE